MGEIVKNMGSLGESDTENGVLTALHTRHLRNGALPPPGEKTINKLFYLLNEKANPAWQQGKVYAAVNIALIIKSYD